MLPRPRPLQTPPCRVRCAAGVDGGLGQISSRRSVVATASATAGRLPHHPYVGPLPSRAHSRPLLSCAANPANPLSPVLRAVRVGLHDSPRTTVCRPSASAPPCSKPCSTALPSGLRARACACPGSASRSSSSDPATVLHVVRGCGCLPPLAQTGKAAVALPSAALASTAATAPRARSCPVVGQRQRCHSCPVE